MDTLNRTKNRKSARVKALYDSLERTIDKLPQERRLSAHEELEMGSLAIDLKQAITDSGLTHYAIGKAASVDVANIDRFMSGERKDLRLETAGKIADALGYRLTKIKTTAKAAKPKPTAKHPQK